MSMFFYGIYIFIWAGLIILQYNKQINKIFIIGIEMRTFSAILFSLFMVILINATPITIIECRPEQKSKTFAVIAVVKTINNSPLPNNCVYNCAHAVINYRQKPRNLANSDVPILTILNIIQLPNNVVKFIFRNPPIDINNATIIITINNPNLTQTIYNFHIPMLYSSDTMDHVFNTPQNIASEVLISILLFVMLLLYIFGYKNNHTLNFIQKISFLRFNLPIVPPIFSFLYSLRYSYYGYGVNALHSVISPNYLQNSNGNFYLVDKDANILRNVGIIIVFSMATIVARLLGLVLFKKQLNYQSVARILIFEKTYYRITEYFERTIMFPIVFFSIAEITFANLYGRSNTAYPGTYNASLAFSVIYIIYFAMLVISTFLSSRISKYAKLQLISEYLFGIFDSIIIIQTYYTSNVLALIITIVFRCAFELFLKYSYSTILKYDAISIIIMALEIALIGVLNNRNASLSTVQALFAVVVVIDLVYAIVTLVQRKNQKDKDQAAFEQQDISASAFKSNGFDSKTANIADSKIVKLQQPQQPDAIGTSNPLDK